MRRYTAAYLKDGEQATYRADESAEILLLGLPDEARIGALPLIADETQDSAAA
jgi:hypothetical protein